jgi:hypothetical protein
MIGSRAINDTSAEYAGLMRRAGACLESNPHQTLAAMRYIIPSFAVIFVAFIFPNNPLALAAYIAIALYSLFLITSPFRKASPPMRRQILIASSFSFFVALGIGAFLYFR